MMKSRGISNMNTTLAVVGAALVIAGCSAGGSSTPTKSGGTTTTTGTITESLSSSTVTSAAPATVSATVRTSAGAAVAGTVVTFTTGAVGSLSSATALTNSAGVATVTLSPLSALSAGADTVVASATIGSTTVTASQGYQLNATTAQFTSFTSNTGTSATEKLAAYGQAVLTINMTGVSAAAPAALTLTSQCVAAGKATISPATVSNSTGTATFTYKDSGGCGSVLAADTVTATIGSALSSSAQIYLTSPTPNSITFSSATPPTIYLKGSGYTESSSVKFQVVDTDGNPLPGQPVTLALSTLAGGLLINQGSLPVSEASDANGFVSVIINSGTVPTPVRVTATLASGITTVSSQLAVATGLPTQLHFSLSQTTINIEGANRDGTPNSYTVRATDRSGNPVPDGTSILFWAEGGQVQATATTSTTNGISSATANFVSQDYRPADGRVTVLAYAIGEESFIDKNGTNVYQLGDPFQDLGDIVKSRLFDNNYDSANDETISLSLAGTASGSSVCNNDIANYPQFLLDKFTPVKPGTCDGQWSGRTYVRKAAETVFSTSLANPLWPSKSGLPSNCSASSQLYVAPQTIDTTGPHRFYPMATNSTWYTGTAALSGSVSIIAADQNVVRLNPMPAGTVVSISSNDTAVLTLAIVGGTPIVNSGDAGSVGITYKFAAGASAGSGTLNFTTPAGLTTSIPFGLSTGAPPSTCP
jgi:hypothetical protein